MALYDVCSFDGGNIPNWLLYKYPKNDFNTKMSLIVNPGQVAICVHDGRIEKILEEGKYILNTELLPFIKLFVKQVHGGANPYPMDVYFANKRLKLDMFWGTSDPIKIIDPEYHVQINVRARGQMGFRLEDYQYFLQTLVGTIIQDGYVTFPMVQDYFRGITNLKVKKIIASYMLNNNISFYSIAPHTEEISQLIQKELTEEIAKNGFQVSNFSIESINVPPEDTKALGEIFNKRAEFEQLGDERYRTSRGYDVLEKGASNEGAGGAAVGAGVGLGIGMQAASQINGQNNGGGIIPPAHASSEEKKGTFACPECHGSVVAGSKFCPNCGHKFVYQCPKCGAAVEPLAKFCPNCGQNLREAPKTEPTENKGESK